LSPLNVHADTRLAAPTATQRAPVDRAVLVHGYYRNGQDADSVIELGGLAQAAGTIVCAYVRCGRGSPHRKTFISPGKVLEVADAIRRHSATIVIFEAQISPIQERNLARELDCSVIDRVRLVLDIFALRARTNEGKLQVELAQLQHLSTRLVRGWSHLERQRGGIGLRGPGETQLETDRRLLGQRMRTLRKQLDRVRSQRTLHRRHRQRKPIPLVSLVGYTNAGKSSLFNRLTNSEVYVAGQLFATLDPTIRRIELPGFGPVLLSDTVGFIRELPHSLVEAFRATLEEVVASQLLIHVVDFSQPDYRERISEVEGVLGEIGALDIPRVIAFNKIDLTVNSTNLVNGDSGFPEKLWLSAATGIGTELFEQALLHYLGGDRKVRRLRLAAGSGKCRARIYEWAEVRREWLDDEGNWLFDALMDDATVGRLEALRHSEKDLVWMD
jgi:GTP-binding protein HflX